MQNQRPDLPERQKAGLLGGLHEYLRSGWRLMDPGQSPDPFSGVFETDSRERVGIHPVHPLSARPDKGTLAQLLQATGILPKVYTSFDLLRRPFWVANNLFQSSRRR